MTGQRESKTETREVAGRIDVVSSVSGCRAAASEIRKRASKREGEATPGGGVVVWVGAPVA
jgi:hypothetical protein